MLTSFSVDTDIHLDTRKAQRLGASKASWQILREDLKLLDPGQMLNDRIINAHAAVITTKV